MTSCSAMIAMTCREKWCAKRIGLCCSLEVQYSDVVVATFAEAASAIKFGLGGIHSENLATAGYFCHERQYQIEDWT